MIVPWQENCDWKKKLKEIIGRHCENSPSRQEKVEVAEKIRQIYLHLDSLLDVLCARTCPGCEDICCRRATVWFDEKDLSFLFLTEGEFPGKQVQRNEDGSCCFLGAAGCELPRYRRPFICTWYLCPAQKQLLQDREEQIFGYIDEVKALRLRLRC